ncbi:hypothetical protein EJB05_48958 [Eragrostis curvula]|uniref:Formin-like protein n=1 Tax=Eragrostis curvula TaxID=38414 RepID=A0A5J9T350_9POAL|nr:hypothetical protein EJB05_48958 [Eragrostis curvula]
MGSAMKFVLLLCSAFVALLLLNFEALEGAALRLASRQQEVGVVPVAGNASFSSLARFRMLIGLNHHLSRHRMREKSAAAPAQAPTAASAPAPVLVHEKVRPPAPAPLPYVSHRRMPLKKHSHVAPLRSVARRLGGGGQSRLSKGAIVALAVIGACLLVLGVIIAAVSFRRSKRFWKGGSKPFRLFLKGSRAQRSPGATRKVSSHPSPDLLYLSTVIQGQENYPTFKQSSESKGLSILSTLSKSRESNVSDCTVKNNSHLQSDEAESFHSIPCSNSSSGSITELTLKISDRTVIDPSPYSPRADNPSSGSPHADNSPSGSSYQSLSPDLGSQSSPKSPTFTNHSHFPVRDSFHCLSEKLDAQKTEVHYKEAAEPTDNSGSMTQPEATEVEQLISKFKNQPPGFNSTSHYTDSKPSRTNTMFRESNANANLDPKMPSTSSAEEENLQTFNAMGAPKAPPPPPPPNKPPKSLKAQNFGQPPLPPPLPLSVQVGKDGLPLPRLRPLHWDKVRAASNRSMVWNDIQSTSFEFEFDEQMIKCLFAYNFQGPARNEEAKSKTLSTSKHVIEHHKLQNTTILLKTLNASTEQVCSSITEGIGLSVQQLEALVKMKPTKEEEEKLLGYDGDINMLDPAENFVKALLTIPMAFARIETMLYKETFDDEVAHLKMSFSMINGACFELRSSKLFIRLLEAVLKTGNRMNVGTIRGGASAFKLDALLKLADIRGSDGKTTLLHFVVKEMARSQGLKALDKTSETSKYRDATPTGRDEYREMATEFVSELSNELGNVKKVASIDLDTLKSSISNLSHGLAQLTKLIEKDVSSSDKNQNFLQCMRSFQAYAESTMQELKVGEAQVLLRVRELTEYYHGEVSKDDSNLLHIFVIMRDFLGLLDRVCREIRGSKNNQPLNVVLALR